jgi:hypothetical protein
MNIPSYRKVSSIVPIIFIISSMLGIIEQANPASIDSTAHWKTYQNKEYGFEIKYPRNLQIETTFRSYYHLSNKWRAEAYDETKGKPVISIPIYRISNSDSSGRYITYPLYFSAELRIGVSSDTTDIANYLKYYPTESGFSPMTVIINGIVFHKFAIHEAGMSQYLNGISYRAIHHGKCYVVEQLETGSSAIDEPNPKDIPDSVLNSYYREYLSDH